MSEFTLPQECCLFVASAWDYFCQRPTGTLAGDVKRDGGRVSFSLPAKSYTAVCIEERGAAALSLLREGEPVPLLERFAFQSGETTDKFSGVPYRMERELPVLKECAGSCTCLITARETRGNRIYYTGKITWESGGEGLPLSYQGYLSLGGRALPGLSDGPFH